MYINALVRKGRLIKKGQKSGISSIYPSPFLLLLAQTINMMVRGPVDTDIMAAWMDTASQTSMLFTKAGASFTKIFLVEHVFQKKQALK